MVNIIDDRENKNKIVIDDLDSGDYFILDNSLYIKTDLTQLNKSYEKFKVGFDKLYDYCVINVINGKTAYFMSQIMVTKVNVDLHIVE